MTTTKDNNNNYYINVLNIKRPDNAFVLVCIQGMAVYAAQTVKSTKIKTKKQQSYGYRRKKNSHGQLQVIRCKNWVQFIG